MGLVGRIAAAFSAILFLLLCLTPSARAELPEQRRPETTGSVPELPGGGVSPMLLAALGGYLLTGGLALLLLRR
ncbi:hypothetical protein FHR83_008615 [Actinoplanes campanulatus]|uniref:Uncharacterized protein n=1 Tax=Actinoplanes campanulatus TaxID=113559 RepID=A0A7W5ARZ4_9ACTN|nr:MULTISPECIES: hypothetical protein [Actinoplanes]MBB3100889.1 hypothetical protein [Actinoplanes campanulatus]GGN46893.1 hypothetical protein GCM10010109_82560 [Actinoplanes campanulatus]GID41444.1 hypothetical protein Aca09nite_79500 [Actinoplanes campanulatus]GID50121.1 hypothetical protein Aca07nite_73960 [Actinoplanes capillaceus]